MSGMDVAAPLVHRAARPRPLLRLGPVGRWAAHLIEMVLVMLIGMEILFGEFTAVANAAGYADVTAQLPELSTVVMALTMAGPMALWMAYRGHPRRGVAEMEAAMLLPAMVVLAAGAIGLVGRGDLAATYHLWMYVAMVGLMVYRRSGYTGGMAHG
jgi:hypothetical protein